MTELGINFLKFAYVFYAVVLGVALAGDVSRSGSSSRMNIHELENLKFDIEIDNQLKLDSRYVKPSRDDVGNDRVRIKSVNGQTYECEMPSQLVEEHDDIDADASDDQSGEGFFSSLFFESTNFKSKPTLGHANQAHFDFPLIEKELKSYLKKFNDSDLCLYKVLFISFLFDRLFHTLSRFLGEFFLFWIRSFQINSHVLL